MAVKATLKIHLLADEVLIAESDDQVLWQRVFAAIQSGPLLPGKAEVDSPRAYDPLSQNGGTDDPEAHGSESLAKEVKAFAHELGVSIDIAVGACAPSLEAPYIHMDDHHWEALKKHTPERGPKAISGIVMASTLLALWYKHARLGPGPTLDRCHAVLNTIGLRDTNAPRSLKNCPWLQLRGETVTVNPAERSKAVALARTYALKDAPATAKAKV